VNLTVLSVAIWLTVVGPDSVGGAEQILLQIDHGLVRRGHHSLVIARPESRVAGTLIPTVPIDGRITPETWKVAHDAIRKAISYALDRYPVDVIHMHELHFGKYLPCQNVPILVSLHLPLPWYNREALATRRPKTFFHCVSRSQRETSVDAARFLPDIENGISSDLLRCANAFRKRNFSLLLGRICPEKGFHLALRAARQLNSGMLLAGRVFPFEEHQRYFAEQIVPELDTARRYIGPVGLRPKRRLLGSAQSLVVPSLVPETSSLVAREALACGTPVVAFARGALPEIVKDGKTGFLIQHESDLPDAIRACQSLDPAECRKSAAALFTSDQMVDRYVDTYRHIVEGACPLSQTA
jgi:glycosyltransferase involved in cell wall biosynthesis